MDGTNAYTKVDGSDSLQSGTCSQEITLVQSQNNQYNFQFAWDFAWKSAESVSGDLIQTLYGGERLYISWEPNILSTNYDHQYVISSSCPCEDDYYTIPNCSPGPGYWSNSTDCPPASNDLIKKKQIKTEKKHYGKK